MKIALQIRKSFKKSIFSPLATKFVAINPVFHKDRSARPRDLQRMSELSQVRVLLKTVSLEGAVVVKKRVLLFMLGWGQDRAGAWQELLNQWERIGEDRETLKGIDVANNIVLTVTSRAQYLPVMVWAGETPPTQL